MTRYRMSALSDRMAGKGGVYRMGPRVRSYSSGRVISKRLAVIIHNCKPEQYIFMCVI